MTDINQWAATDSSNNGTPPTGWPSGVTLPSQVEPGLRAMMGGVKRWHDEICPTVTSAGTNTITVTYPVVPTNLVSGDAFSFIAGGTNTGAATFNPGVGGAKAVQWHGAALSGNEIVTGRVALLMYDGTVYQLLNSQLEVSSAALATVATSGSASDLSAGTTAIARGGTGAGTALAAFNAIVAIGATVANPGYIKLENGLIFQWGHAAYTGATSVTATFATAFGGTVFSAVGISDDTGVKPITILSALSLTQITFAFDKSSTGNVYYWAVGN